MTFPCYFDQLYFISSPSASTLLIMTENTTQSALSRKGGLLVYTAKSLGISTCKIWWNPEIQTMSLQPDLFLPLLCFPVWSLSQLGLLFVLVKWQLAILGFSLQLHRKF